MLATAVERRIVTVLFADLVGFTSLSERLDAEDVATVQEAYFAVVRETVGRYGGELEKFIGDAAMAVFGIPIVRDDDAERAVRAGLALTSAVEQLAARIGLEEGDLMLRVGVNTGEVAYSASGPGEGRVTGDTVNSAARLQTAARPGTVLIGETTQLAVAEAIETEPAGRLQLKGKSAPVPAWTAVEVRPVRSRDLAMGALRAPMHGRERELAALGDAFAEASVGARQLWVVVAPPGVGKTRLVEEFAELARGRGAAILRARCRPDVLGPYQPVAQLLSSGLAAAGFDPGRRTEARAFIEARLTSAGEPPARAAVVAAEAEAVLWPGSFASSVGRAGSGDRAARFDAWLAALDALAGPAPRVLLCEDVHWAGGDFLAFLEGAVDARADQGRLVVATSRPALRERAPEWTNERAHVLDLPNLSPAATSELVRSLVGDAVPAEILTRIGDASDGNPLFVEELLRTWASVGILVEHQGGWRVEQGASVRLPATVQAIYAAQLDDLPASARQVARRASVAGRRFPVAALGAVEVPDGEAGVAVLVRRALVSGPDADPFAGPTYAYRHALLRDAGYASLARAERSRLHIRLARWIEDAAGDRTAAVAEVLAGHYAAVLDALPALAPSVEGLTGAEVQELAATWFERAAGAALEMAAQDAARALSARALELTPEEATLHRARRWELLGDATAYAGDMDEGALAYEAAADRYRGAMEDPTAASGQRAAARTGYARAITSLGLVWGQQLRFEDAVRLAEEGLRVIGDATGVDVARLLYLRAWSRSLFASQPGIREDLERALELSRTGADAALELEITQLLAQLAVDDGTVDLERMLEQDRELIELARGLGEWRRVVRTMRADASILLEHRVRTSWELLDEAEALAQAHGLREDLAWIDYVRAEAGFGSGAWDRAWASASRALDLAERNAYHRAAVRTWFVQSAIASARGRADVLEQAAAWLGAHRENLPMSPYAKLMVGAMDRRLIATAGPPLAEVLAVWDEPQGEPSVWDATDVVASAWIDAGSFEDARAWLEAMARWHAHPLASDLARGTHTLIEARLHLAEGSGGRAATTALAAAGSFRDGGFPWWVAKAIRVAEAAGGAEPNLVAEAARIERDLGIP